MVSKVSKVISQSVCSVPERICSAAIHSRSVFSRIPDQNRSSSEFPLSLTPIFLRAAKRFFFEIGCRYPSSSHPLSNVLVIAIHDTLQGDSNAHAVAKQPRRIAHHPEICCRRGNLPGLHQQVPVRIIP